MSISRNTDGGGVELRGRDAEAVSAARGGAGNASEEPADRERVEQAGFPYPIRRCPPREMGQR